MSSSMMIGQGSLDSKPATSLASSTGPSTTKHVKASARSVEKHGPAFQRLINSQANQLNQTQQQVHTMQTQMSATKQFTNASSSEPNNTVSAVSQPAKSTKKSLMQKAVVNQQKQLLQMNMNYQVVDHAFLTQLKSSAGSNAMAASNPGIQKDQQRSGRAATGVKTTKSGMRSSGTGQIPANGSVTNNLFEFMSVQTGANGIKGQQLSTASRHFSGAQVSQSTRHAGKNFDRLNFSSNANSNQIAQQNSSSSQRQQELFSNNSRLMQYEHSNNRISLCTDAHQMNESGSHLGQTSQLETSKNANQSAKRSQFKSSERASKVGTHNLKVQTQSGKPDFTNLVRQPASTKNNATKKHQLEGQMIISGIISKKTIAESLAKNQIHQKMLNVQSGQNNGHLSTKSGKATSGAGYINEASLLMQVNTQMQTPHNQGKSGKGSTQIQNQISAITKNTAINGSAVSSKANGSSLHKRKASTQSNTQYNNASQRVSAEHTNGLSSKLNTHHNVVTNAISQKGGGSQRAGNSNKNSAIKDSYSHGATTKRTTTTARSSTKPTTVQSNNNQVVKLKLTDEQRSQELGITGGSLGHNSLLFDSYAGIPQQPTTVTNTRGAPKNMISHATNFSKKQNQLNAAHQSFNGTLTKASKSQERNQTTQHTGQKSVTNKYTKILAGVDDFDSNPPQIHVPAGISSATNRLKKSFNFDTVAIGTNSQQQHHQEMNSLENSTNPGGQNQDAASISGAQRTRQELMNQILMQQASQHQQTAASGNFSGSQPMAVKQNLGSTTAGQTPVTKQSQKQAKVQNMKTQQLLLLQQQYAQANNLANMTASGQPTSVPPNIIRQSSLNQGGSTVSNGNAGQQQSSGSASRKVLFSQGGQKLHQPSLQTSQNGKLQPAPATSTPHGNGTISKKQTPSTAGSQGAVNGGNKAAKSVSQSKPPAHAQYFNSAKVKNEGAPAHQMPHQNIMGQQNGANLGEIPNRTAITTGYGKTQIEIQGNQMLCLWNVNIGQGASANYIDQKGSFNLPYQMFQNTNNMMQQQPLPTHFYPQQMNGYQFSQPNQTSLQQSSSKESIQARQHQQGKSSEKGRLSSKPKQQAAATRQIDINIHRKSGGQQNAQAQGDNEIGIYNKHFKRPAQTKQPTLNIKTKKQVSAEAIMQQQQQAPSQSAKNNQTQNNIITQKQITLSSKQHGSQHEGEQKVVFDQHSTKTRFVKLTQNNNSSTQQQKLSSSSNRHKQKAQNTSSMEQRRGSNNSRQPPQSRGHSSKKHPGNQLGSNAGNQPMMLLTDNRELVEAAQQHMPRVNLSTTNKTSREINLNNLMMENSSQQRGAPAIGTQQTKQLKQMGLLVNNFFQNANQDAAMDQGKEQQTSCQQQQQHKRMQSLMTDPQFITQIGLRPEQEALNAAPGQVALIGDKKQSFKGHTTKNTSGNPSLFNGGGSKNGAAASMGQEKSSKQSNQPNKHQATTKASKQLNQTNFAGNGGQQQLQMQLQQQAYILNTGYAPKAKKPPVAFKEEDLYDGDLMQGDGSKEAWMLKMEQELDMDKRWQHAGDLNQLNDLNRMIARDEAMAKEARLAMTSKGPLALSLQTANPLGQNQQKLKTQDVSEIIRKAKQDLLVSDQNQIQGVDGDFPFDDEEDCVVEETDPDEIHYPKHEPAQLSSLQKNKASNLSQHTSSTMQQHQKQKSPKHATTAAGQSNEATDSLLKGAYLREQQAARRMSNHGENAAAQQKAPEPVENTVVEEIVEYPMTVRQALKLYAKTGKLTDFEKTELLDFKKVYFLGLEADKIKGKTSAKLHNSGYDDENGDYQVVLKDHIYYRFEVLDFLGKGSFGQALKCLDHKTGEIVAVKIIKNKERYQHQAGVELRILQHLQKQDPEDQNNIIQIKDHCVFRNHLIISFELFSINLYEFIKNNNFQGVSLSLIRRFAIQILQSLKFLKDEDVIHCDLKPENILLKSPDKSGIKIIDFGSSCFSNQRIYSYIQSRFYRAPEIIIGIPYTTGIDMWSFGCILIELYTGIPIFPGESEMEQLALIMQVFGVPPLKVLDHAERKDKFFRPGTNEPLHIIEDTDGSLRLPGSRPLEEIIGDQSETFFDFIVQCLAWDPEERIQPLEALQHPWILEGLPRRVLIHHQRMLGLDVPSESSQASLPTDAQERLTTQPQEYSDLQQMQLLQEQYERALQTGDLAQQQVIENQLNLLQQQMLQHQIEGAESSIMMQYDEQHQGANPFEMAENMLGCDDYDDSNVNQEMLDLHNRSTQKQLDQPKEYQLPARVLDNGMANQFKAQQQVAEQQEGSKKANDKQEMSRTQPMPAQFLHNIKKQAKQHQQQHEKADHAVGAKNYEHAIDQFENLNYQSHENGQQMLHIADSFANRHMQYALPPNSNNDQLADICGIDDLVDQDEFQEAEHLFNPKAKTTNMSSLLKQINQSIKKQGSGGAAKPKQPKSSKQFEIETGEEIGANNIPSTVTTGSTRYKLPQSTAFTHAPRSIPEAAPNDFEQQEGNVSFLMKHRIRQGETTTASKVGKVNKLHCHGSATGTTMGTTMAAPKNKNSSH